MHVLLANDSSSHSKAAADYLIQLPFRKPIDLEVVSVVAPPMIIDSGTAIGISPDVSVFITEECEAARARVERTADQLGGPVHSVHTHVPVGSPSGELLSLAKQTGADLIVLGAVGHSALERVLLGSVSDYVATHSDTSTLVVRPARDSSPPPALNKIVVALSGNPDDERMIDWLRCLKLHSSVELHLVRILQLHTSYRQDIREQASDFWRSLTKHAEAQILDLETKAQAMGLNTETHLVESSHVGEALVDYSEEHGCDLIITGDSDSGLLTRLFLGSTSRYVLRHTRCSVLIVRSASDQSASSSAASET